MKRSRHNWLKVLLQWGVLLSVVALIILSAEGLITMGSVGEYIRDSSLGNPTPLVQIIVGVLLAVGLVMFAKLFCGYLCPLGTLSEMLGKLGRRMKMHRNINFRTTADKALRSIKYILLFIIVYFSVTLSGELLGYTTEAISNKIILLTLSIVFGLLFLGNIFFTQFWCKYICPIGALTNIFKFILLFLGSVAAGWAAGILGLPNAWVWALALCCIISYILEITRMRSVLWPPLYIKRNPYKCIDCCEYCEKKCPQHIPAHKGHTKIKHIDCTLCGECITQCPIGALGVNNKRWLYWFPGLLALILLALAVWLISVSNTPDGNIIEHIQYLRGK